MGYETPKITIGIRDGAKIGAGWRDWRTLQLQIMSEWFAVLLTVNFEDLYGILKLLVKKAPIKNKNNENVHQRSFFYLTKCCFRVVPWHPCSVGASFILHVFTERRSVPFTNFESTRAISPSMKGYKSSCVSVVSRAERDRGFSPQSPQVAHARNMSISEHRYCCVSFKI